MVAFQKGAGSVFGWLKNGSPLLTIECKKGESWCQLCLFELKQKFLFSARPSQKSKGLPASSSACTHQRSPLALIYPNLCYLNASCMKWECHLRALRPQTSVFQACTFIYCLAYIPRLIHPPWSHQPHFKMIYIFSPWLENEWHSWKKSYNFVLATIVMTEFKSLLIMSSYLAVHEVIILYNIFSKWLSGPAYTYHEQSL